MNRDILNNYTALITSSQNTISEMTSIMNHQETTLRHIIHRDYDDINNTITTLRRENAELRRSVNNARTLTRENEELRRLLNNINPLQIPRANVSPRMAHREIRPVSTTFGINQNNSDPIRLDRNRNEPGENPNVLHLPNNHRQYMRRYLTSIPDLLFGAIGEQLTPVVVSPSEEQIREATQLIRFGSITDPQNSSCPISLERFGEQQLVTRILFCGHLFSTNELQIWFGTNVRCPLCRFDIREHRNQASRNNLSPINEEENINNTSQINSNDYPQPPIQPQEENTNVINDEDSEEEFFNNISRNVDTLLSTSNEINNNLSRTILENINILRPLDNNNITSTNILDVFNDISSNPIRFTNGRLFFNNYLDISNNV